MRVKDTSTTIEIETYQTSLLNEVLSKILGLIWEKGLVRLEIILRETTNSGEFVTSSAYITGYPTIERSGNLSSVVWKLNSETSIIKIGGKECSYRDC